MNQFTKTIAALTALALGAASATRARASDLLNNKPCQNDARLTFDDVPPNYRLEDPRRDEKRALGVNPLQTKEIVINATESTISILIRTHDSFQNYWDYAQKRDSKKITAGTPQSGQPLRGELTRFIAVPKGKGGRAIDVRVWLEYTMATGYTAQYHVTTQADAAVKPLRFPGDPRPVIPADIAGPINVSLGLNEAEIRIPTKAYGFEADDEIIFHFRKGDTSVCVPDTD